MERQIQPDMVIEDGVHQGVIISVEERTKPYQYIDVKIEFEEVTCKSSLTGGSGHYRLNPYVGCQHKCIYCYTKTFRFPILKKGGQ